MVKDITKMDMPRTISMIPGVLYSIWWSPIPKQTIIAPMKNSTLKRRLYSASSIQTTFFPASDVALAS